MSMEAARLVLPKMGGSGTALPRGLSCGRGALPSEASLVESVQLRIPYPLSKFSLERVRTEAESSDSSAASGSLFGRGWADVEGDGASFRAALQRADGSCGGARRTRGRRLSWPTRRLGACEDRFCRKRMWKRRFKKGTPCLPAMCSVSRLSGCVCGRKGRVGRLAFAAAEPPRPVVGSGIRGSALWGSLLGFALKSPCSGACPLELLVCRRIFRRPVVSLRCFG